MDLIHMNAIQFNGADHQITAKALYMVEFARAILKEFDEHLTLLEVQIQKAGQGRSSQDDDNDNDSLGGGYDDLSMTGMDEGDGDGDFEEVEEDSSVYLREEESEDHFKTEESHGQDEEEEGEYISDDEPGPSKRGRPSSQVRSQPRSPSKRHNSGLSMSPPGYPSETEAQEGSSRFDSRGLSFDEDDSSSRRKRPHYDQFGEGEHWNTNSDDDSAPMRKRSRQQTGDSSNLDDEDQQAIEAMMELSKAMSAPPRVNEYGVPIASGSSFRDQRNDPYYHRPGIDDPAPMSVQNIHADLEVSDSDNEDDSRDKSYDAPPRQDGQWF